MICLFGGRNNMPELLTLLNSRIERPEGTYIHNQYEYVLQSKQPLPEKVWDAWVRAYTAYYKGKLQESFQWLELAMKLLKDNPDNYCLAEVTQLYATIYSQAGENTYAIKFAKQSYDIWYSIALKPIAEDIAAHVNHLRNVLYEPEKPPFLHAEKVCEIWLADRLSIQFLKCGKDLIQLCGLLWIKELGAVTINNIKKWFDTFLLKTGIDDSITAIAYADLLETAGNFYDNLGELEVSYTQFKEGIDKLMNSIDHPEVYDLRARLQFNAGNELAKLHRNKESSDYFSQSLEFFKNSHDKEAAVRIRHAILLNDWYQCDRDVMPELEEILLDYEKIYKESQQYKQLQIQQNINAANRLWITMMADGRVNTTNDLTIFLTMIFSMRQPMVGVMTKMKNAASAPLPSNILNKTGILNEWFSRLKKSVLFIIEDGVDHLILTTIRSGKESIASKVHINKVSIDFVEAFSKLFTIYQEEISDISNRIISIQSQVADDLIEQAKQIWISLPIPMQKDIEWADTIYYAPSNYQMIDELPFELVHNGDSFLGLKKIIVRVLSINHLLQSISMNRVNKKPGKKALVVYADDVAGVNKLQSASQEVKIIENRLEANGYDVITLHKPSVTELKSELKNDPDLFHFIGHSEADDTGEYLLLNDNEDFRAFMLNELQSNPAPLSNLSSCYAGRTRQLISGAQQGMAATLLNLGAPAVLAATFELPDQLGVMFSEEFYKNITDKSIGNILLSTRNSLANQEVNPVCWASCLLIGNPDINIDIKAKTKNNQIRWPQTITRYICTRSSKYLKQSQELLYTDNDISNTEKKILLEALNELNNQQSSFFNADLLNSSPAFAEHNIEAKLIYYIMICFGWISHSPISKTEDTDSKIFLIKKLLTIEEILHDSYLFVATIEALLTIRTAPLLDDTERNLFAKARQALAMLSADQKVLKEKIASFNKWQQYLENTIIMDAQALAGVDVDTFRKADEGDRQAQKRMLSNLWKNSASTSALTSKKPWTEWMLRLICCAASEQSLCDFLGVIDVARKQGKISEAEYDALLRLVEQFIGPDSVDQGTMNDAYAVFDNKEYEYKIISLFDYFDLLTTDTASVTQPQVEQAIDIASNISDTQAITFFQSVWCQKEAEQGRFTSSLTEALKILQNLEKLVAADPEITERIGVMAMLITQLYQYLGDLKSGEAIQKKYQKAIKLYTNAMR